MLSKKNTKKQVEIQLTAILSIGRNETCLQIQVN